MKKILLVADQGGWVFEYHCKSIKKYLPEFDIDIVFRKFNIRQVQDQYDLIYVLDPMPLKHGYPNPNKTIMGLRCEFLYREHPEGAKGLYENGFPGRCVSIKDKCSILHVVNENQMKTLKDIVIDKPLLLVPHGVDSDMFDRSKYAKTTSNILRVSTSGRNSNNKGFGIVKQVCDKLQLHNMSAQYGGKKIPKEEMPKFYNNIDVHVCMSKDEGLSNPILEAGAMGVPIVSTRCGGVEEIIEDGVNGFLIDRNSGSLQEALLKIQNNNLRQEMGNNIYKEIMKNWTWKIRIEDFRKMFNKFFEMNK